MFLLSKYQRKKYDTVGKSIGFGVGQPWVQILALAFNREFWTRY